MVEEQQRSTFDRDGLEILGRQECLKLLATKSLGRLGLTVGALPSVLPVNYRLIGDRLYFRISAGERLRAATTCAVVAFEVDCFDEKLREGWTVMVTGVTEPIEHADILERLESIGIPNWSPTPLRRVVAISTDVITGRRLVQL